MPVLGDDPDRSERRGRAQDRADVMRVGDLVEDQQHGALSRAAQDLVEPDFLERLGLDDHALVRRVARDQAAEVGDVGQRHRNLLGELHRRGRVARRPRAQDLPPRIVERGCDRVLAPQPGTARRAVTLMRFLAARHRRLLSRPAG